MKKYLLLFFVFSVSKAFSQEKTTVYFDLDHSEPTASSIGELKDWALRNKEVEILKIYGYCDSIGSLKYNDQLAAKRVNSIYEILKETPVKLSDNLKIKTYGERFEQLPVQAENRKVEIYYQTKSIESLSIQFTQLKTGDRIRLKNLNFYNASGKLVPKSEPFLAELLLIMQQNPKLKIQVEGHICCEYQDYGGVSYLRSKTIYDYLVKNGIDKKRLSYKGFGSSNPIYPLPEQNEFERNENRRVEIKIIEI
ncbi:MAG: OmpA family protein [Flavobacterium sp.]